MFLNILKNLTLVLIIISCSKGGDNVSQPTSFSTEPFIRKSFVPQEKISKEEFTKIFAALAGVRGSFSVTTDLSLKEGKKTCVGTGSLKVNFEEGTKRFYVERIVTKNSGSCIGNPPHMKYQTKKELRLDAFFNIIKSQEVEISEGTFENKPGYLISLDGGKYNLDYVLVVNDKSLDYLITETNYNQNDGYLIITTKATPLKTSQIDASLVEDTPETGDIIELSEFGVISLIN